MKYQLQLCLQFFWVFAVRQRLFLLHSPLKPYCALGMRINLMGGFVPNVNFCIKRWVSIRTWCFGILVFIYILYMAARLVRKLTIFSKSVWLHMKFNVQLELSGFNFSPPLWYGGIKHLSSYRRKKLKPGRASPIVSFTCNQMASQGNSPSWLHCCHWWTTIKKKNHFLYSLLSS